MTRSDSGLGGYKHGCPPTDIKQMTKVILDLEKRIPLEFIPVRWSASREDWVNRVQCSETVEEIMDLIQGLEEGVGLLNSWKIQSESGLKPWIKSAPSAFAVEMLWEYVTLLRKDVQMIGECNSSPIHLGQSKSSTGKRKHSDLELRKLKRYKFIEHVSRSPAISVQQNIREIPSEDALEVQRTRDASGTMDETYETQVQTAAEALTQLIHGITLDHTDGVSDAHMGTERRDDVIRWGAKKRQSFGSRSCGTNKSFTKDSHKEVEAVDIPKNQSHRVIDSQQIDSTPSALHLRSGGPPLNHYVRRGQKIGAKKVKVNFCQKISLHAEQAQVLKLPKEMQGRWSRERYEAAQYRLVEIMHEKGALPGRPILRPALRQEARNYIGDTGLLDHLLKHMTNTVVSSGERFRRRHNDEGSMEYWLEDANLMETRKAAGIDDPFWTPPPGWKLVKDSPADRDQYSSHSASPAQSPEMQRLTFKIKELNCELQVLGLQIKRMGKDGRFSEEIIDCAEVQSLSAGIDSPIRVTNDSDTDHLSQEELSSYLADSLSTMKESITRFQNAISCVHHPRRPDWVKSSDVPVEGVKTPRRAVKGKNEKLHSNIGRTHMNKSTAPPRKVRRGISRRGAVQQQLPPENPLETELNRCRALGSIIYAPVYNLGPWENCPLTPNGSPVSSQSVMMSGGPKEYTDDTANLSTQLTLASHVCAAGNGAPKHSWRMDKGESSKPSSSYRNHCQLSQAEGTESHICNQKRSQISEPFPLRPESSWLSLGQPT